MFGDIAHGLVLLTFGLVLIFMTNKLKTSAFKMLIPLRYMVTMMGFFACYCGWIYNDFLGISFNLFGSCYPMPSEHVMHEATYLFPKPGCTYPFGVDPAWERSSNELQFVNSLKMKLAVILGVIHMVFGIGLKAVNCLHFGRKIDFYFEFIPQMMFMVLIFGYMDFLIVFKWLKYYSPTQVNSAPSIISTMINIPLKMGHCVRTNINEDKPVGRWKSLGRIL
jgi:V-type H+-transporting ATPase subunit a